MWWVWIQKGNNTLKNANHFVELVWNSTFSNNDSFQVIQAVTFLSLHLTFERVTFSPS